MTHEIDAQLDELTGNLAAMAVKYGEVARRAAETRLIYDLAWADEIQKVTQEFEKAEKKFTVPERDAIVTLRVKDQMRDCRLAEADLDVAKKYIANIEARLSATQTRVKLLGIEANLD